MTQEEFISKMQIKYPNEPFNVLKWGEQAKDKTIIKCVKCGRHIEAIRYDWLGKKRNHICSKCYYKRKDTIENENKVRELLQGRADNIFFAMRDGKIRRNTVSYTCTRCGRVNTKDVANILRQKEICGYCEGTKQSKDTDSFRAELEHKYGNKFTLVSEYVNALTKITLKCNKCGFIRSMKPNTFLDSGYCPKCDNKDSRGEKAIVQYLTKANIRFTPQMYFSNWNIGIHYFDFYLPDYNLVLEFHGRQHYEFVEFFHKDEADFLYRCQKDASKKKAALEQGLNYVSINYHLIDKLDIVLDYLFNSTTIPEGSRGKCFEIETIQGIG